MKFFNLNLSRQGIYFVDRQGNRLRFSAALKKILNRFYHYYLDFKLFVMFWVGWIPSHFIRNNFFRLCGVKIGRRSTFHTGARFFQPKNIQVGEGTIIGYRCFLDGRDTLKIGSHTDIASEVMIYNSEHDVHHPDMVAIEEPVYIGDYVFIGPRAIILPGVTIADGAVVAAGAIVTHDVPEKTIVAGVPARPIGKRKLDQLSYRLGRPRLFQ